MTKRGFTLIELLVSISIFGLLSSFVVANYSGNERTRLLKNQAQLIISGLEKTQNMSMTGTLTNEVTPLSYKFLIKPCQTDCYYEIVAVINSEEEVLVSKTSLRNTKIKTSSGQELSASFQLPRGRMSLNNDEATAVWLEASNNDTTYCLKVTAVSGRIDLSKGNCPTI